MRFVTFRRRPVGREGELGAQAAQQPDAGRRGDPTEPLAQAGATQQPDAGWTGAPTEPGAPQLGVLLDTDRDGRGGRVLPLAVLPGLAGDPGWTRAIGDGDLAALLAADPDLAATRQALEALGPEAARALAIDRMAVRLLAPVMHPSKIVCVGQNYADHIREQGIPFPDRPSIFAKFANAVAGDGDPVVRHDATNALDLEAELAVVIGRRASRVPASKAMDHVAGYTVVNDISARDLQGMAPAVRPGEHGDGQWLRAKGSDSFLPMGPALVTADEIPDPHGLVIRSWRTAAGARLGEAAGGTLGEPFLMQDSTSAELVFRIPALIEFISAVITLEPGDVIPTGTPPGVGNFRNPPIYLEPGDVASCYVEGIGRIDNPIVASDGSAPPGSPAEAILNERA